MGVTAKASELRLERLLASGGMGAVWIAWHRRLEKRVAVKLMASRADCDRARARFAREALAAQRIRSRHVVAVLDHDVSGDTPYIAMELLAGEDLRTRLRRERRLSLADAARITDEACRALTLAHLAGIVHRDVKPANLFLARDADGEHVKLLDFGLATGPDLVRGNEDCGRLFGSPHYMSPEQVRARPVDARSDLWSLAVSAFEMLSGHRPFGGHDLADVLVRVCTDPIPSVRALRPSLPREIDDFFARALARDPQRRFASAAELAAALAAVAAVPSAARSPSTPPPRRQKASGVRRRTLPDAQRDSTVTLPIAAELSPVERQGSSLARQQKG